MNVKFYWETELGWFYIDICHAPECKYYKDVSLSNQMYKFKAIPIKWILKLQWKNK